MRRWNWLAALVAALWVGAGLAEPVARLEAVTGLVEVRRDQEWLAADEGDELELADEVRTDVEALARLVFLDEDAASGAEATVVDLSPETHIRIEEFLVEGGQEPSRSGFLDTIRGALNAITKGWANGSIFSVRAGTTVCGIRGSAANVAYDPSDGTSTVTHLDGDLHTFEAADIAEGLRRHRANRQALRRRKRLAHGSVLKRAQRHRARRGARAIRERVDARTHSKARLAVLTNRRGRRLERSAEWLNHFSKVRPTGRRKRARTGKTLRSYVQQRRKLRRELRGGPGPGVGPGGRPRPGSGEVREKLRQGRKTIRKQRRRGSPRRRIRRRRR